MRDVVTARRGLLEFLLASPLLANAVAALAEEGEPLIRQIDEALNVADAPRKAASARSNRSAR